KVGHLFEKFQRTSGASILNAKLAPRTKPKILHPVRCNASTEKVMQSQTSVRLSLVALGSLMLACTAADPGSDVPATGGSNPAGSGGDSGALGSGGNSGMLGSG